MKYPDPSDYFSAVQERNSFKIDKLKRAEFVAHPPLNLPIPVSGSSAVVFKAIVEAEEQALRFFTRDQASIRERYLALGDYFSSTSVSDCMAMSRWVDNAIVINGQSWPMVQMQWVNGRTLDQYVASLVEKKNLTTIAQLAAAWRNLIRRMQAAQFAHGDLQHGNVLVDEKGDLRLVDFDCVWIEPFSGKSPPSESGHRNYQHVGRPWGQWMDTFPGLVIYISLLALSKKLDLWETFHDGENLLFQQEDFTPPFQTDRWRRLTSINDDGELNLLVEKLKTCCAPGWTADGTLEKLLLSWSPPAVPPPSAVPSPPTVPPPRMGQPESAFPPSPPESARWWDQVEPNQDPHRRRRLVVFGLAAIGVLVALGVWLYPNPQGPDGSCLVASAPALKLQPNHGDINTKITASGVGFVPNGKVRLTFRDDDMGEATTDCAGQFNITAPIPNQNVYTTLPNTRFDIRATEYTGTSQHAGNGDSNPFYVQVTFLLTDLDTTVMAYQYANVRDSPHLTGTIVNHVEAGASYQGLCWEKGDPITKDGITTNVWIKLLIGYVSAAYLEGDEHANLTSKSSCSPVVTVRSNVPEIEVNVRAGPDRDDTAFSTMHAGDQLNANCWTTGENVSMWGTDSDIWIEIIPERSPGHTVGYVWAGGLKGDRHANVPNSCG